MNKSIAVILIGFMLLGCEAKDESPKAAEAEVALSWDTAQDVADRVIAIEGFSGPEAVRYDAEQDVYFVANFNGDPAGDANGFVSRVSAEGEIESLEYMTGTDEYPLHGARGMYIAGDLLWVADAGGIHAFDRQTGAHVQFVDFSAYELGFINDISQAPDGALYVTETGSESRVFKVDAGELSVALQNKAIGMPNGITWDAASGKFVTVAWSGTQSFTAFAPGSDEVEEIATSAGGNFDGVEIIGGRMLVASQMDSTLRLVEGTVTRPYIMLPAAPADIGVDTKRNRVAVPYVGANRVDIWALPGE